MKRNWRPMVTAFVVALIVPLPTFAHQIGGNGLMSGLSHPILGLDHLLAIVAVGVISTQRGGSAVWKVPATFLTAMLVGGVAGMAGLVLPGAEFAIALSVLMFGAMIALQGLGLKNQLWTVIALFGIFHGHAHGAEMPLIAHPAIYAFGFVLTTAVLHISGVVIGHLVKQSVRQQTLFRYGGVALGVVGVGLLLG